MGESLCDQNQPWGPECSPYNPTATGYLGSQRRTMLENPLLQRTKLGKQRTFCTTPDLGQGFVFGDNYRDCFNVGHALNGWAGIVKPPKKRVKPRRGARRDHMSMNRAALSHGMVSAKEYTDFKCQHEVHQPGYLHKALEIPPAPFKVDKERLFGAPSGNIKYNMHDILSTKFQDEWIRSRPRDVGESTEKYQQEKPKVDYRKYYQNHACNVRTYMPCPKIPRPLWHMPKFARKAKPHLCTFRSAGSEQAAYQSRQYDRVGREGDLGAGIAIKALNHVDFEHCPQPVDAVCSN
ncbi:uncharacterized protein LOC101855691 [Aplysia californica]|uniref:Uncharacterized protein LOC101855691 n=1 Tax=Aplysia californica TaxID=6500 RepID=A0ABM0K9W0_APLCA|nr:uncharacterized protein LOC101855691 [Aplysia californica]